MSYDGYIKTIGIWPRAREGTRRTTYFKRPLIPQKALCCPLRRHADAIRLLAQETAVAYAALAARRTALVSVHCLAPQPFLGAILRLRTLMSRIA
jgi:hypothetical protein